MPSQSETVRKLFRAQVQRRPRPLEGEIRLDTPPSVTIAATILGALMVAALLVLAFGRVTTRELVQGWIVPSSGVLRISAPLTLNVLEVLVDEGQQVTVGQSLVVLGMLEGEVAGRRTTELLSTQLADEANRVEDYLGLVAQQLDASKKELRRRSTTLESERDQLKQRIKLQLDRVDLARQRVERLLPLKVAGMISQTEYENSYEEWVAQEQETGRLKGQLLATTRDLSDVTRDTIELERRADATTRQLLAEAGRLQLNIIETLGRDRVVLRAPVESEVAFVGVHAGQVVDANELQIALVPTDSELCAELFIPSRAAGVVKRGQEVRIHYDAFPYQKFGAGQGLITKLSNVLVSPSDLSLPLSLEEPVLRGIATLTVQEGSRFGTELSLVPGMTLNADVVVDERYYWEVLFVPLLAQVQW